MTKLLRHEYVSVLKRLGKDKITIQVFSLTIRRIGELLDSSAGTGLRLIETKSMMMANIEGGQIKSHASTLALVNQTSI